jgi:hypothetical protein
VSTELAVAVGVVNALLTASLLSQWKIGDHLRKIEEHLADMRRREKARR